jgi:hypothetical protein
MALTYYPQIVCAICLLGLASLGYINEDRKLYAPLFAVLGSAPIYVVCGIIESCRQPEPPLLPK